MRESEARIKRHVLMINKRPYNVDIIIRIKRNMMARQGDSARLLRLVRRQVRLREAEVLGVDIDGLGLVVSLVDTHEAIRDLKHEVAQGNHQKLRVLCALLDVVRYDGHVLEVQRRVNLVHNIDWCGLVVMQGEDEGLGSEVSGDDGGG